MAQLKRPADAFRRAMLWRLRENRDKGGWAEMDPTQLVSRLLDEVAELLQEFELRGDGAVELLSFIHSASSILAGGRLELEVRDLHFDPRTHASVAEMKREHEAELVRECADVANFAMMIADNFGNLRGAPWIEKDEKTTGTEQSGNALDTALGSTSRSSSASSD